MKFTIKINQKSIIQNKLDVDVIDAVLLDFLKEFSRSESIVSIEDNGSKFYWFSHDKILDELPILGLKKDSVFRRLKKLCEKGFLIQSPKSQALGRSFYSFTKLVDLIGFQPSDETRTVGKISEGSEKNPKPKTPSEKNPKPLKKSEDPSDEIPNDKNTNDNTLLFPKENNLKKESVQKLAVGVYFDFYKNLNGVSPKFDGADGKALNSIIDYFKKLHKEEFANKKTDKESEEYILYALKYIFDNWGLQVDFIRNQTKMTQINSNLNNIINKIRNAKSKSTSANSTNKGNQSVRKIAKFTVEEFGITSENNS